VCSVRFYCLKETYGSFHSSNFYIHFLAFLQENAGDDMRLSANYTTLDLLIPSVIFDPHAAFAALEQLVDVVRDK